MSTLDVQVPDPNNVSLWRQFVASTFDRVTAWVSDNPESAAAEYDGFRAKMRAFRADLCAMAQHIEGLPTGSPARQRAVSIFCPLLARYARYSNLVYGGTTEARAALYPDGDTPCDIPLIQTPDGAWKAVACVGAAQFALAPVAVIAVAVCVVAWLAADMVDAATGVSQIREIRRLHEAGAPETAINSAAESARKQASSGGVSGAVSDMAGKLMVGVALAVGAAFVLPRLLGSR